MALAGGESIGTGGKLLPKYVKKALFGWRGKYRDWGKTASQVC